jgi:hypothetical protein
MFVPCEISGTQQNENGAFSVEEQSSADQPFVLVAPPSGEKDRVIGAKSGASAVYRVVFWMLRWPS